MTFNLPADLRYRQQQALEIVIHVGLAMLLLYICYLILRPFLSIVAWGAIIAIAIHPGFKKAQSMLGGRQGWAAALCAGLLLLLLLVPVILLADTVIDGVQMLAARAREGTLAVPPPPPTVASWPVIGTPLNNIWSLAATNLTSALRLFAPQIKAMIPTLLSTSAGVGLAVGQFVLSIILAGILLGNAQACTRAAHSLSERIFGERAEEFQALAAATIRSVTTDILGVAVIQTIFACIGFIVARMPGAGIWVVVFLFAAVVQVGGFVMIAAGVYMFAIASTTKAVIFMIYCVFVALMDNFLKPILLGRGVAVPMVVIFLGAIGGFLAMGIIGLFLGAILLSVGYRVLLAWLQEDQPVPVDTHAAAS